MVSESLHLRANLWQSTLNVPTCGKKFLGLLCDRFGEYPFVVRYKDGVLVSAKTETPIADGITLKSWREHYA